MSEELARQLKALGLTGHEGRVLAGLVDHSPSSAAWLAKHTGLSRSSVYTTLDALVAKGLVSSSYQNEVKQFHAAGHGALMDKLEAEQAQASARVVAAQALRERFEQGSGAAHTPGIAYFEGVQGLQRVYMQMLREARGPGPMLILRDEFVWTEAWAFVHEQAWRERVAELKARTGLATRLLVHDSALERGKRSHYASRRATEFRYLPSSLRFDGFACYVLDDVVSLLSFDAQALVGLRIANRVLARSMGTVFEALWAAASEAPVQQ